MNRKKRKRLRSIRAQLQALMQIETMEPRQTQEVLEAFSELRRAYASNDKDRQWRATARIAALFVEVASNDNGK